MPAELLGFASSQKKPMFAPRFEPHHHLSDGDDAAMRHVEGLDVGLGLGGLEVDDFHDDLFRPVVGLG